MVRNATDGQLAADDARLPVQPSRLSFNAAGLCQFHTLDWPQCPGVVGGHLPFRALQPRVRGSACRKGDSLSAGGLRGWGASIRQQYSHPNASGRDSRDGTSGHDGEIRSSGERAEIATEASRLVERCHECNHPPHPSHHRATLRLFKFLCNFNLAALVCIASMCAASPDATCEEMSTALKAYYNVKFLPPHPKRPGTKVPIPEHVRYTSRGKPSLSKCANEHARGNKSAIYRAHKGTKHHTQRRVSC